MLRQALDSSAATARGTDPIAPRPAQGTTNTDHDKATTTTATAAFSGPSESSLLPGSTTRQSQLQQAPSQLQQSKHQQQQYGSMSMLSQGEVHENEEDMVDEAGVSTGTTTIEEEVYDGEEEGYDDDEEDDDEEGQYLLDQWRDEEEDNDNNNAMSMTEKIWNSIKTVVLVIANVENLWDEEEHNRQENPFGATTSTSAGSSTAATTTTSHNHPISTRTTATRTEGEWQPLLHGSSSTAATTVNSTTTGTTAYSFNRSSTTGQTAGLQQQQQHDHHHNQARVKRRRRSLLVVWFWFFVLATAYASERSAYKFLVDFAGPFRLFSIQVVTLVHIIMILIGMLLSHFWRKQQATSSSSSSSSRSQLSITNASPASRGANMPNIPLGIPIVDVGLMSLLDSVTILLVFVTGMHVPPTLTVILVQFTLPLTAFLTQFVHPQGRFNVCCGAATKMVAGDNSDGQQGDTDEETTAVTTPSSHGTKNSEAGAGEQGAGRSAHSNQQGGGTGGRRDVHLNRSNSTASSTNSLVAGTPMPGWGGLSVEHLLGSLIIALAVGLGLTPACYSIAHPAFFFYADSIPLRTAINTLLYASSCFTQAASQLYKEHIFLQYRQPVNATQLNLLLSVFQFVFLSIVLPLVFVLQGLGTGDEWMSLYPSTDFTTNFYDGLQCFLGQLSKTAQETKYPEQAVCDYTLVLAIVYAFAIIMVGVAVDKIVNAGATKVLYRGVSVGIILAVLCMYEYDMHTPTFNYGPAIDALTLTCLLLLILGSEIYHRVSLQESTFETVYPEVPNMYAMQ